MDTWTFSAVVIFTLVSTNLLAGFRARALTSRMYQGDPNQHGALRIALSLLGTIVGGGMFLGMGQVGFEGGIAGIWIGVAYLLGFILTGLLHKRIEARFRMRRYTSLLELLEAEYSSRVALQFALVNLFAYLFLLSAQFLALFQFAAFASSYVGTPSVPWILVTLGIGSMALYTVIGGLHKDILADTVQVLTITCALSVLFLPLIVNGWPNTLPSPTGETTVATGYGPLFLIGAFLFIPPSFLVRMDVWQRIRASRSVSQMRRAFLIAGAGSFVFFSLFTIAGMWARRSGISNSKTATLALIVQEFQNPIMLGLIIGGLFAAVLSSADTYMNNASIMYSRVFSPLSWKTGMRDSIKEDRKLLSHQRKGALAALFSSFTLALWAGNLVTVCTGALTVLLIYFLPILGILFPSLASERAAFFSSLGGLIAFLIVFLAWNQSLAAIILLAVSTLTYFAFWKLETPENRRELNRSSILKQPRTDELLLERRD